MYPTAGFVSRAFACFLLFRETLSLLLGATLFFCLCATPLLLYATPLLLLRNLDPGRGLCNGTRLVVTRLGRYGVVARIVGTEFDGEERILPRVKLIESDDDLGFR